MPPGPIDTASLKETAYYITTDVTIRAYLASLEVAEIDELATLMSSMQAHLGSK